MDEATKTCKLLVRIQNMQSSNQIIQNNAHVILMTFIALAVTCRRTNERRTEGHVRTGTGTVDVLECIFLSKKIDSS